MGTDRNLLSVYWVHHRCHFKKNFRVLDCQRPFLKLDPSCRRIVVSAERRLSGCDNGTTCREGSVANGWLDSSGPTAPAVEETGAIPGARAVTTSNNTRQSRSRQCEAGTTIRPSFGQITATLRLWRCSVQTNRDARVDPRPAVKTQISSHHNNRHKTPSLMMCMLCKPPRVQANSR